MYKRQLQNNVRSGEGLIRSNVGLPVEVSMPRSERELDFVCVYVINFDFYVGCKVIGLQKLQKNIHVGLLHVITLRPRKNTHVINGKGVIVMSKFNGMKKNTNISLFEFLFHIFIFSTMNGQI